MKTIERGELRSAEAILAEWRAAERARDGHEPGSRDWIEADERVDAWRRAYQECIDRQLDEDGATAEDD